jgi:acetylornithine deacetylase/succinyl-diaminopimelate desuccinylase-like protein
MESEGQAESANEAGPSHRSAAELLGDDASLRLLEQLVSIAPTNLEDPAAHRTEKPHYTRAAEAIVRTARGYGLATRIYDPVVEGDVPGEWHGFPRPNVVVDLDAGAERTVLVLAHYDVVPVPAEQRSRWRSPPHTLTFRADGRLYGRGANDDLGSGVVSTLLALRRLAEARDLPTNVRLIACCDEETGGEGGIEAIRAHDAQVPERERLLRADVALIPDGSPETTAGSSGVAFLEASFAGPVPLSEVVAAGETLVGLHELARSWRSAYSSPDWPERNAPEPVITGRASVTKFDVSEVTPAPPATLSAAHAESDAANQIARAVTLVFEGPPEELARLPSWLETAVPPPYRVVLGGTTALTVPPTALAVQVVGEATHGGYPHRGHNPVPAVLALLRTALEQGLLAPAAVGKGTFTVDLRLPPEMELPDGLERALGHVRDRWSDLAPSARLDAPPSRCRPGYALPTDHPAAVRLERLIREILGGRGIQGEYGGTDASALRGLRTPKGDPLPALVFGSMDPLAHIHDAEESVEPRLIAGVARVIERFVRES